MRDSVGCGGPVQTCCTRGTRPPVAHHQPHTELQTSTFLALAARVIACLVQRTQHFLRTISSTPPCEQSAPLSGQLRPPCRLPAAGVAVAPPRQMHALFPAFRDSFLSQTRWSTGAQHEHSGRGSSPNEGCVVGMADCGPPVPPARGERRCGVSAGPAGQGRQLRSCAPLVWARRAPAVCLWRRCWAAQHRPLHT
jgi:hypothetical protein